MDRDDASGSLPAVQRFQFSTREEAETEEFIRRMYIGNRLQFLSVGEDTRFTAKVAATGDIAVSRLRATVDFRGASDPLDYFLFLAVTNGRLQVKTGRDKMTCMSANSPFIRWVFRWKSNSSTWRYRPCSCPRRGSKRRRNRPPASALPTFGSSRPGRSRR